MPKPQRQHDAEGEIESEIIIPWLAVKQKLDGVTAATESAPGVADRLSHSLRYSDSDESNTTTVGFPLRGWCARIQTAISEDGQRHFAFLAVPLAFLHKSSSSQSNVAALDLDLTWSLIYGAIKETWKSWRITRSSQGFLSVALSSIIQDGNIKELFRLHIWEPEYLGGHADARIHSHQTFLQIWVLAGEGRNHEYDVKPAEAKAATHAEYSLTRGEPSGSRSNTAFQIPPSSSIINNTQRFVRAVEKSSQSHARNMTYTVPANSFHSTEVHDHMLHATVVLFDAAQGFSKDASVLGLVTEESSTVQRSTADVPLNVLCDMVDHVRVWERLMRQGRHYTLKAEFEEALREYRQAMHVCESQENFPASVFYKCAVMEKIGFIYRTLGRNELACQILEDARKVIPLSQLRAEIVGELAVVYRHMNRFHDAREASEDEYATAQHLHLDRQSCRAIGTLGMINYQLSLTEDPSLLEVAVTQLTERVESARRLKQRAAEQLSDPEQRVEQIEWAAQREAIGLGRLSMCFQQQGNIGRAINTALESLNVQSTTRDPGLIAFSRGQYGLCLLAGGYYQQAIEQLNVPDTCSPIIYLCREPSDEHRVYINEMISAGADLEIRDELGYSALDCAVYSGDLQTQELIEGGLRRWFRSHPEESTFAEERLDRHRYEAVLRKGYRDIFQDRLRPVLLQTRTSSNLTQLRRVYSATLEGEQEKALMFDPLKYVPYVEFLSANKIPRSDEGYKTWSQAERADGENDVFIIFLSYRWLAGAKGTNKTNATPDNDEQVQYKRMIRAIELFRNMNSQIEIERLGIWIDFACIDQADYDQQKPGMAALMMNLTQCDAMISLVDESYYDRSWCCLEVLMYQTLRETYGKHLWYEHVMNPSSGTEFLGSGPSQSERKLDLDLSRKKVTYSSDRPMLLFLERQTKLIS